MEANFTIGKKIIMKNAILLIIGMCITFFPSCCDKDGRDSFSFERRDYLGFGLKTNGYFYNKQNNVTRFIVINRNGVVFGGYGLEGGFLELEGHLRSNRLNESYNLVYNWGVFEVISREIVYEKWVSSSGCDPYPVYTYTGEILNDTTIVFDNDLYDTMRFRQFSPKPDSVTRFIE